MDREIYYFEKGKLSRVIKERKRGAGQNAPSIHSDLPGYISPVGNGWVEGRSARREDLKRSGCREVDPSEYFKKS